MWLNNTLASRVRHTVSVEDISCSSMKKTTKGSLPHRCGSADGHISLIPPSSYITQLRTILRNKMNKFNQ